MTRKKSKVLAAALIGLAFACLAIIALALVRQAAHRPTFDRNTPFHFTHPFTNSAELQGLADFTSNIPIIVLRAHTPGTVSRSKEYTPFTMEIYEPTTNSLARLTNAPAFRTPVGLRLHGMVSRQFPKLSYRLKLRDESSHSRSAPLLGMPSDADWVLQGPWLDKSLIRNAFSYDLARAMGCAAMRTRVCELFLSASGNPVSETDYVGVYQLTEDIERGEERVKLAKLEPNDNSDPTISGGYLLAWDVGDGRYLSKWNSIQVKYPKQPSPAQMEWIDGAFTRFNDALRAADFDDPDNGYAAHIEVDDWVNYILFEELVFNLDGYTRSFYLHKDRGEKIRPGPVWDHDLGLGHQFPNGTSFTQWWFTQAGQHRWVTKLMKDPAFAEKMGRRWRTLRKDVLSDERIAARIDSFTAPLLSGAADRNFERWKILDVVSPFTGSRYITIATATYPEQINALKEFLRKRAAWMDAKLGGE
jgi:hypothetical protein